MKNALLALALFAFVGTAAASGEKDGKATKAGKKEACATEMKAACAEKGATAATPSCCMKKGAKTSTAAVAPAAPAATTPVQKSL